MIKATLTVNHKVLTDVSETVSKNFAETEAEKQIKAAVSVINALDFWKVSKITIEFIQEAQ